VSTTADQLREARMSVELGERRREHVLTELVRVTRWLVEDRETVRELEERLRGGSRIHTTGAPALWAGVERLQEEGRIGRLETGSS
jgi:hypothetical protein